MAQTTNSDAQRVLDLIKQSEGRKWNSGTPFLVRWYFRDATAYQSWSARAAVFPTYEEALAAINLKFPAMVIDASLFRFVNHGTAESVGERKRKAAFVAHKASNARPRTARKTKKK